MENEVTCCWEALKLRRKAVWRLMERMDKYSFDIKKRHAESDRPILIAKEDLKNHGHTELGVVTAKNDRI